MGSLETQCVSDAAFFVRQELSSFFPTKTMVRVFYCALVSCVTLQVLPNHI